jgi:hypothetical protein
MGFLSLQTESTVWPRTLPVRSIPDLTEKSIRGSLCAAARGPLARRAFLVKYAVRDNPSTVDSQLQGVRFLCQRLEKILVANSG